MTKKTIYGGLIILVVFTMLVAVGIFLMQRYNGIANAEAKIHEAAAEIDTTVADQKTQVQSLLDASTSLKDTPEYSSLTIKNVSLSTSATTFFKDDTTFQENLTVYLDAVAKNSTLSKDEKVSNILGQIQGDAEDLRNEKLAYNAAVDAYNKKKNARPQFYGQFLGFKDYHKFTNIPTPLDTMPTNDTNPANEIQNPNSFN